MNSPASPRSEPRTLPGLTFDGQPFSVKLTSGGAFDRGASAGIYKGTCSGPWPRPRVVAVKIFSQMLRPVQQELFVRDLQTASQASLRHPRILEFLGTLDVGDQKSLVSLYMRNGNLLEYITSQGWCDKRKLIFQVAEAVAYLHTDAGLVHGDLKCANVLISDSGDALLADFGLSTFVEKSQSAVTTMTSIRDMHTARFAAPELLLGTYDPAARPRSKTRESDVYAFGMLALEAISELPPWPSLTTLAVIRNVGQGQQPAQATLHGFVATSHRWWDTLRRCWMYDPSVRPAMASLLEALRETEYDPHRQLVARTDQVLVVRVLPDGLRVVTGSSDGFLRLWDTLTGSIVIGPLFAHSSRVLSMDLSPDGRQLCTGGGDGSIRRWDAESLSPLSRPLSTRGGDVNAVAYSPDGTRIISGSGDGVVRFWHASSGAQMHDAQCGHGAKILAVAFSPDRVRVASASRDATVRIWDSTSGQHLALLLHKRSVPAICFSADGAHLFSGSADKTVRMWDVSTLQLVRAVEGHLGPLRTLALSPDGRYIATGSDDSAIRIWDAETGDAVGTPLIGHTALVRAVAFSSDGRSLVSAAADRTVRVWDLFE